MTAKFYAFGRAWTKHSLLPLIALGVILVVLMTVPALVDGAEVDLNGADFYAEAARITIPWVWGVFVFDVAIRFLTARHRGLFVRNHWLEIVAVVIPFLPHLKVLKLLSVFLIIASRLRTRMAQRIVIYVLSTSVISWYVLGLGITEAEGQFGTPIGSLSDGLWWSFELLTTGAGFDENFPTTEPGRVLGAIGFVLSYAVIGGITASLVAWLVSVGRREEDEEILSEIAEDTNDIDKLRTDIAEMRAEISAMRDDLKSVTRPKK